MKKLDLNKVLADVLSAAENLNQFHLLSDQDKHQGQYVLATMFMTLNTAIQENCHDLTDHQIKMINEINKGFAKHKDFMRETLGYLPIKFIVA